MSERFITPHGLNGRNLATPHVPPEIGNRHFQILGGFLHGQYLRRQMPKYLLVGEVVILKRPAFQQQEKLAALSCRQGLEILKQFLSSHGMAHGFPSARK